MTTNQKPDLEAFEDRISKLEVSISKSADGLFTACSSSDPLFCFDAHSEEDLNALIVDTINSYGKNFFGIPDAKVGTKRSPVGKGIHPHCWQRINNPLDIKREMWDEKSTYKRCV